MKVCKDLAEFFVVNDKDINNILQKFFKNILQYYSLEDLKSDLYLRMHRKEYIQNYRPFEIELDIEEGTWFIKPSHAKFSTYICKFIFNYMYAYHNKVRPDWLCLSLEKYKDNYYCKEDNTKITIDEKYDPLPDVDLKLDVEGILNYLKMKTQNTGTPLIDNSLLGTIAKNIDKYGDEGCPKEKLILDISQNHFNNKFLTGMEEVIISSVIDEAEKNGLIVEEKINTSTNYFINRNRRRSLYNLFKYYMKGYKDKEISEQFKMTVAGIGALKRSLRKEITEFYG